MEVEGDASEWVGYDGGEVDNRHRSASRIRVAPDVATIPPAVFARRDNLRAVDLSNVTTISGIAFLNCRSLERVVWTTASAVEIGGLTFASCIRLREIDLRNTAKIGESAFHSCRNLVNVELGGGIQLIERRTFSECRGLVQINVPASVTDIGEEAFEGCSSLREVVLHEGLQHVGKRAFQECTALPRIDIPSTTLKVGRLAFAACDQLRCVALKEGLQMIGAAAFMDCRSLERITIPSSVTLVDSHAFLGCASLAKVTLREGVLCIGNGVFDCTPSLKTGFKVPPGALMVESEPLECRFLIKRTHRTWDRKLIVSKWMQYRSRRQLDQAEAKVNEILGRREQNIEEKFQSIREWFTYYDQVDVTTILELAIWKCSTGNEQGAEARQAIRRGCGNEMSVIVMVLCGSWDTE